LRILVALVVASIAIGACLASASPAHAAFPGYAGLIVYESNLSGHKEIWTMTSGGGNQTRLTTTPGFNTVSGQPSWSPDGTRIVFVSNRSGAFEIYTMNVDGSNQTMITNNGATAFAPTWSPDGSRIAFASFSSGPSGNYDIWVMNADGTSPVNVTNDPFEDILPAWSPDGRTIAFQSSRTGNRDIFLMNPDGSSVTNITNTAVQEGDPDWSPDGSHLVFARAVNTGAGAGLVIVDADGANPQTLGGTENATMPVWSPDGVYLAFYLGSPQFGLYRIHTSGTQPPVQMTNNHAEEFFADWQPLSVRPPSRGEFTSLTPARILDTRDGTGRAGATAALGTGQTIDVQITGRGGVAASGVAAVVLNATVTQPTQSSFLTIWPAGVDRPDISNLNFLPGQNVPNLVTVAVGAEGKVSVFNLAGSTHVIFDVVGFYADDSGPAGSRFHPTNPFRYFDTRDGTGGVAATPIGPDGVVKFNVLGKGEVPASGVTGVVMNVTVTNPTLPSFLTVYPDDVGARPVASNLNYTAGQSVPNLVVVRVPANGVVDFYNLAGSVDVLADVVGFYDGEITTEAGRFIPLAPARSLDTRASDEPLGPNEFGALVMAGFDGVPATGAGAVVINTTVTGPTAPSFLTVFPDDLCEIPLASNLNFVGSQTVPNLVVVRLSAMRDCAIASGAIDFYNLAGTVHVIVDVFGYFTNDESVIP